MSNYPYAVEAFHPFSTVQVPESLFPQARYLKSINETHHWFQLAQSCMSWATFQWVTLPIPPLFSHILHSTPCGAAEACGNLYCAHFEWGGGGYDMQANPHSQVPTPNEQLQGWTERTNKLTNQSVHRRGGLTTPRGQDMPPAHWYLNSLQYTGQVYTALVYAP